METVLPHYKRAMEGRVEVDTSDCTCRNVAQRKEDLGGMEERNVELDTAGEGVSHLLVALDLDLQDERRTLVVPVEVLNPDPQSTLAVLDSAAHSWLKCKYHLNTESKHL